MSPHPITLGTPVDHAGTAGIQEKAPRHRTAGELATCRCGATWTGQNVAHCGACHQTFSGPSLFDRHRHARGEHGGCYDPNLLVTKLGKRLMFYRAGMWRAPEMSEDARARFRYSGSPTGHRGLDSVS